LRALSASGSKVITNPVQLGSDLLDRLAQLVQRALPRLDVMRHGTA
jgi:hypothetical protein